MIEINVKNLIDLFDSSYKKIINYKYDYIFGNSKIISDNKIGCSILLSRASVIEHLLFYIKSDTTHMNPINNFL